MQINIKISQGPSSKFQNKDFFVKGILLYVQIQCTYNDDAAGAPRSHALCWPSSRLQRRSWRNLSVRSHNFAWTPNKLS